MSENEYILITSAFNEAEHIGNTVEAVIKQSLKPVKWIIVSDGSTDNTDSIICQYADRHDFIKFIRREKSDNETGFISKVSAIRVGYDALDGMPYRFIGILDADITFGPDYYESILSQFHKNPVLGLAGGFIYEQKGRQFRNRPTNTINSVAGGIQLFRRECYEAIGGHRPARFGGEDWICEIMSRMKKWQVQAFPEIIAYHQKKGSGKRGFMQEALRIGKMDYSVGAHPLFEIAKCLRRIKQPPYLICSVLQLTGYIVAYSSGADRVVDDEVITYLRTEQRQRLKNYLHY